MKISACLPNSFRKGPTRLGPLLGLLAALVVPVRVGAQPADPVWPSVNPSAPAAPPRGRRIRLFRIAPGFLSDPVGVEDDDAPGGPGAAVPPAEPDSGADWIEVTAGKDNPYFDFRQPGDPGGLGFYKVCTQVQLLDTSATGCALNVQAVTPAGLQFGGLPDGPTVLSPALSVYQDLGGSTALQGFVGKNVPVNSGGYDPGHVRRCLQYGLALQRPLVTAPDGPGSVYLYLGTLGQYRTGQDLDQPLSVWDLLPGMHWQMNDNAWISSALMVPLGGTHVQTAFWQLTCSFQF